MNLRISQKIKEIQDSLQMIEEALPANIEEFNHLGLVKDGIYKRLEFCIQNLIDIFSMIYIENNLGVPGAIDDIFIALSSKKLFSKKILQIIGEMKGLRNILAHRYGVIDDNIIFEILKERLGDFELIISAIEEYYKKKK